MAELVLNLDALDPYRRRKLGEATMHLVLELLAQPGGREMIEEEKERMRREALEKGA